MGAAHPEVLLEEAKEAYESKTPDFVGSPNDALRKIVDEAPIYFSEQLGGWVISRRADVCKAMRDPEAFPNSGVMTAHLQLSDAALEILGESAKLENFLGNTDGARHVRLRAAIARGFTPRAIGSLEPYIRETAAALADRFAALLQAGTGPVDLKSEFAGLLPGPVTARLVGLPEHDVDFVVACVQDWFDLYRNELSEAEQVRCANSLNAYYRYVSTLIEGFRQAPAGNLISELVGEIDRGQVDLSEQELIDLVANLFVGGMHTTAGAMASIVLRLLRTEGAWAELREHPELVEGAVEEALRLEGVAFGGPRTVASETVIDGQELHPGERVYLLSRASDLDAAFFPDPESYCPGRDNAKRHLVYGIGRHICIGAPLARAELRIGLEELVRRVPALQLATGEGSVRYVASPTHRQIQTLLVETSVDTAGTVSR